jgi:hypothetical protein
MKRIAVLCGVLVVATTTGCMTKRSAEFEAGVDLNSYESFHVVRSLIVRQGAERGNVGELIQADLARRGKKATFGKKSEAPQGAQIIVTFDDTWYRDITLYLLELKVNFSDATTGRRLGTGSSLRTSLSRKEPAVMVSEILDRCFPAGQ